MNRILRTPDHLARQLKVKLPSATVKASENGHPTTASIGAAEPVDLATHPDVQAALDNVTDDRSRDTYRVVAACYDDRLTLEQTRHVVGSRTDLAGRLDERNDDDVLRCWLEVINNQQQLVEVVETRSSSATRSSTTNARPDDSSDTEKHSSHLGMAVKMGKQFEGKLLYVNKIGWHFWDGRRWAPDGDGAARRAVHAVIKRDRRIIKLLDLSSEEEQKRLKQIARYESASAITGILTEAAALQVFSITADDLDADPYLFNCANGTLDLRTMDLREHDPADRITKVSRAAYDPAAVSTTWTVFLDKVLPDKDVRDYFQRTTGLSLVGEVNGDKQILPIMTGGGANGKTTAIEAVAFAMGDYAMTAEPTLLMDKRGDAHPTGVADLMGRRFVSVCETEQHRRFNIALVKWLTGGDTIKARFMRQNFFSFTPSHLLMLATNHLPRIDDDTEAVWRRIRVIPFTVQIPEAEQDKGLKDRLRAEADAVLTWMIQGWKDYRQRGGLAEPDGVLVATGAYKADSDAVGRFIEDECDVGGAQSAATTQALYERWERWASQDGCPSLSRVAFGRALDAKGYPAEKNTHDRLRRRICLKSQVEEIS